MEDYEPGPQWAAAHAGMVMTARDLMVALEGGPAACSRGECRRSGTCANAARSRLCAKKLSPAAEQVVLLMVALLARLDPDDVAQFYFGDDGLAGYFVPGVPVFDAETRAKLWPPKH